MPKNHAHKKTLNEIKHDLNIKHTCAIALLAHPDEDEQDLLIDYLESFSDIRTYKQAVEHLRLVKDDPRHQTLCQTCGWAVSMICPECPGCGCYNGQCSGWRHHEYAQDDESQDSSSCDECDECGAGGSGNPYEECVC